MFRLPESRYLVWICVAVLLAACGSPSAPTPAACAPSVLASIPKTAEADDTLISLEYEGGLVPVELSYPFGRVPRFVLRADGTAFYLDSGEQDAEQVMKAHLSPPEVQGLLQSVLGLGFECLESYTDSCVTLPDGTQECVVDAGTSTLRVRLPSGELREIRNTAGFANDRDALEGIRLLLEEYTHPSQQPYVPDMAALFLQPADQPAGVTAIDWPPPSYDLGEISKLCVWPLGGADLAGLTAAAGRNLGDFWLRSRGHIYHAHLTPWLPGDDYSDGISRLGAGCLILVTILEPPPTIAYEPTLPPQTPAPPAVLSPAPSPAAGEEYLSVRAFIDGRSQLVVKGDTVRWHHLEFAAPGRLCQSEVGKCQDYPTYLNGIAWTPRWADLPDTENRDCDCDSSAYFEITPLAAEDQTVRLAVELGRDRVAIVQQPAAENDYTLTVEFDDFGSPGGWWYEVTLYYRPEP